MNRVEIEFTGNGITDGIYIAERVGDRWHLSAAIPVHVAMIPGPAMWVELLRASRTYEPVEVRIDGTAYDVSDAVVAKLAEQEGTIQQARRDADDEIGEPDTTHPFRNTYYYTIAEADPPGVPIAWEVRVTFGDDVVLLGVVRWVAASDTFAAVLFAEAGSRRLPITFDSRDAAARALLDEYRIERTLGRTDR